MLDAGVFGIGILHLSLLSRCSPIGKLDRFFISNDYRASHPYAGGATDRPNFSRQEQQSGGYRKAYAHPGLNIIGRFSYKKRVLALLYKSGDNFVLETIN